MQNYQENDCPTIPQKTLETIIKRLNKTGVITDEEGLHLQSTMIEQHTKSFEMIFKQHGYDGGKINCAAIMTTTGAIYALYDTSRFDEITVRDFLRRQSPISAF